jgi:hypothetical protein
VGQLVGVLTRLRVGQLRNSYSILGKAVLHTGCGAYPWVPVTVFCGLRRSGAEAQHLHLVLNTRMCGRIIVVPPTSASLVNFC